MTIEELFKIICPDEFKDEIKLDIKPFSHEENLNGSYSMSFSVLDDTEKKLYKESENKTNFKGTTESIKIYDIEVKDFYDKVIKMDQSCTYDIIQKKLNKYIYGKKIPVEYVFISHMLLHEVGHYKQYRDRQKKVYSFTSWCLEEEKNIDKNRQEVTDIIQLRINESVPPFNPTKSERVQLEAIARKYRNIPKEKEADDFAYSHMKEAMNLLSKEILKN